MPKTPILQTLQKATEKIALFDFPDGGKGLIYFGKNGFVAEILQNSIEPLHLENPTKCPKRALEKIEYWFFKIHTKT